MEGRRGLALLGFMGAGKSAIGRRVAERLGWRHVDLDDLLVARHGPIAAQFAEVGEVGFRARELTCLREIDGARCVLSTGGGTTVDPHARGLVESRFRTVWLDVPLETSARRIGDAVDRPLWPEAAERYAARRPIYGSARARVDATGSPEQVVEAVLSAMGDRVVRVELGERAYDVRIAHDFRGLAERLPPDLRVITETTVGPMWAAPLAAEIGRSPDVILPAGEECKTLATWSAAVDGLLGSGARRSTAVVALGGGVLGDLAGFAASAVHRGLPFAQVPTTLLAMLDASVGGKTGVNHALGKNLIGAVHQPFLVWAPLCTLATLPARERIAGLAEALKIGLMFDEVLLDALEAHASAIRDGDPGLLDHVIGACVRAKAKVVAQDEREAGPRALLNAGHTVGHALERAAHYRLLHGEAVSVGLIRELRWAAEQGHCEPGLPSRAECLARAIGLPVAPPNTLDRATILDALAVDKKASRDILMLPVPVRAGSGLLVPLPIHRLGELLA